MIGTLIAEMRNLLETNLPAFFNGGSTVSLTISSRHYDVDKDTADAVLTEPQPLDRVDIFAYDSDSPPASFTLTQPPYPGPVRVYLTTDLGDRIVLTADEVVWDTENIQQFSLQPAAHHNLAEVTGIRVLYAVIAVHTTIKAHHEISMIISDTDAAQVEAASALALGVLQLNLSYLMAAGTSLYESGDYSALASVKSMKVIAGDTVLADNPGSDTEHTITFHAEIELIAQRALAETEGAPIEQILTPGRPLDSERPVNIHIDVEV